MPVRPESTRRGFMKMLAASPLLAQIAAQSLYARSAAAIGLASGDNVYSRLGVKTVINCRGTWTYLSGSLQFPEVRAAQAEASHYFVNMIELQRGAGRKLAEFCLRRPRFSRSSRAIENSMKKATIPTWNKCPSSLCAAARITDLLESQSAARLHFA